MDPMATNDDDFDLESQLVVSRPARVKLVTRKSSSAGRYTVSRQPSYSVSRQPSTGARPSIWGSNRYSINKGSGSISRSTTRSSVFSRSSTIFSRNSTATTWTSRSSTTEDHDYEPKPVTLTQDGRTSPLSPSDTAIEFADVIYDASNPTTLTPVGPAVELNDPFERVAANSTIHDGDTGSDNGSIIASSPTKLRFGSDNGSIIATSPTKLRFDLNPLIRQPPAILEPPILRQKEFLSIRVEDEVAPLALTGAVQAPQAQQEETSNQEPRDPETIGQEHSASPASGPAPDAAQPQSLKQLATLVSTKALLDRPVDPDGSQENAAKQSIMIQKHFFQFGQLGVNFLFIFSTWKFMKYYYIFLVFITATVALNIFMIFSTITVQLKHLAIPEKKEYPEKPENLVLLIPCYNENEEEMTKSLNSLVEQTGIDEHNRVIMIICDGKVRGPGMDKSTGDLLLDDILVEKTSRKYMKAAYVAWDQTYMDVVLQRGFYRGVPYLCIIKQQNRGKRDSLLVVRSVLYNFNIREEKPVTIFSGKFFAEVASFLLDNGMDDVPFLVGMDADTVFAPDNIHELLKQSRFPNTVGVCGYVAVDFTAGNWNLWKLYQSAEYTIAQALRRLHQSVVTHKVSCLPGCCQLLKVCEETCGDEVLIIKFGYCPTFKDNIFKQILATASEDRNHVCLMLSSRPKVQTRQALKAKAVTDVPQSWAVFLSQRRRWTLGATSNDLYLSTAPGVQWFERILATVNVLTWFLNPFIFASLASFIYAIFHVEPWIVMCFVAVMLVPVWYYLCIPLWLLDTWLERFQFWAGMAIYVTCGPIINIAVLLYAVFNMDSFGWGKTRKVIADDSETDPALLADDASGSGSDGTPGVTSEKSSTPSTPPLVSDHSSRDSTPPPPLRTPPSPPTPPSNWETIRPPGPRKLQKRPRQKKFNCPLG